MFRSTLPILLVLIASAIAVAQPVDVETRGAFPSVPEGFSIEVVAAPPLTERPIVAAFDDEGRLYVAESSGSNDPVAVQVKELPHRVVRLEDTDGDGKFDKRTVFAEKLMLPQGAMFYDGSLYVSAAPSIWKLTDTDGDGVADERSEWFQGKTLTGCANDLHGPYLGPDGWFYWCKGAFAEQTHMVHGREWKSKAAHVFRCRPDGSDLEPVITGGMDNPVDVTFLSNGEKMLSTTLVVGDGRRDGLLHAIYGGVYGKQNGVLEGHARTGELMPVMDLMSPVAPCGLERYDSDAFGDEYRDNLFACQFNLRKVSRHVLSPAGSTYTSADSPFVWSDNVDFHPTDVLVDADGSLIVIDTGGWYKLCCPTSRLWKPDVLGAIYRVRRVGANTPEDPRGKEIDWSKLTVQQIWDRFEDSRPAVRQRALREIVRQRESPELRELLGTHPEITEIASKPSPSGRGQGEGAVDSASPSPQPSPKGRGRIMLARANKNVSAVARTWALAQINTPESRAVVRDLVSEWPDETVRHAALTAIGTNRDGDALPQVLKSLESGSAATRRVAAEALGRIGNKLAVKPLLDTASASATDRILQHSIIFALIELADPAATREGLASESPATVAAALVAIDQMPVGQIEASQVLPLLNSPQALPRESARWLITQHADWGGELADWFREQLAALNERTAPEAVDDLESMLLSFIKDAAIQQVLAETAQSSTSSLAARESSLRLMGKAQLKKTPAGWPASISAALADSTLLPSAVATLRQLPPGVARAAVLQKTLLAVADATDSSEDVRVAALAVATPHLPELSDSRLETLLAALAVEKPLAVRSAAADAIAQATLSREQFSRLFEAIPSAGPLELDRLVAPFAKSTDDEVGLGLLNALSESPALASLRFDQLREHLLKYGPRVQARIAEVEAQVHQDAAAQRKHLEELAPLVAQGDVRRGHAVFYSTKAACSACHKLGAAGGITGPALTHVGEARTERDLLESIVYPSMSFVRGYEPVQIITVNGETINGILRDETQDEYILAVGADQEVRVAREDVEQMDPGTVSIMPAGLEQQLSPQELADLVAFLKNVSGK